MPKMGPPGSVSEKSKDFKGSMLRLFKSLNAWRYLVVFSLFLALCSAILSLNAPNKLSKLADIISLGLVPDVNEQTIVDIMNDPDISMEDKMEMQSIMISMNEDMSSDDLLKLMDSLPESIYEKIKPVVDIEALNDVVVILICLYVCSAILSYIQSFAMTTISNNFAKRLRSNISTKINRLPLKFFDKHETGDILSRVTNDVDTIAQNMNNSLATLVTSGTLFIGSVIMMFYTNWIMAITAILASLIGFGFMSVILKKSQKYFVQRQEELGNLNAHIEEIYSGHNVVKAYNGDKDALKEFNKLNDKLYECNRKSQFLSGLMHPMMGFVGNLGYVCVCIVGALLVMNDVISFGVIVAFMVYVRMFTNPLSQMAQALTSLQSVAASS